MLSRVTHIIANGSACFRDCGIGGNIAGLNGKSRRSRKNPHRLHQTKTIRHVSLALAGMVCAVGSYF